jgi:hypothetical protein
MMEVVREIHPAQHIRLLDVSCTFGLEIMAPDGTDHKELPLSKQVSTPYPLMDPWEIMASSLPRILVIWVIPYVPSSPLQFQVLYILVTPPVSLDLALCFLVSSLLSKSLL